MNETFIRRLFALDGKVAIVLGATPAGIATRRLLAEAGAIAILLDGNADHADIVVDVEDEADIVNAIDDVVAAHGQLDIMIYAATRTGAYPLMEMGVAEWDRMQAINLRGAFIAIREAVRHMRPRGGRIVAVSTMGALHPVLRGNAAYGASKAGLNALVRSVALDHASDGIFVNVVSPGSTPMPPSGSPHPPHPDSPARQPGRLLLGAGTAEDVAGAILFLVSPAGKFITGQNFPLDGGFLIS